MALGYSASNGSAVYPGLATPGAWPATRSARCPRARGHPHRHRLPDRGSHRWGDYTSMNVDPTDDCTFWYVNEYYRGDRGANWRLRIGSFKFAECDKPDFTLGAAPSAQAICAGAPAAVAVDARRAARLRERGDARGRRPAGGDDGRLHGRRARPAGASTPRPDRHRARGRPASTCSRSPAPAGAEAPQSAASTHRPARVDSGAPLGAAPALTSPANGATAQPTAPTLAGARPPGPPATSRSTTRAASRAPGSTSR